MRYLAALLFLAALGCGGVTTEDPAFSCQQVSENQTDAGLALHFCGTCTPGGEHRFILPTAGRPTGIYSVELRLELSWSPDATPSSAAVLDGNKVIAQSEMSRDARTFYLSGLTASDDDVAASIVCPASGQLRFSGALKVSTQPLS